MMRLLLLPLILGLRLAPPGHDDEGRGRYFSKKSYVPRPLPTYTAMKDLLPGPTKTYSCGIRVS